MQQGSELDAACGTRGEEQMPSCRAQNDPTKRKARRSRVVSRQFGLSEAGLGTATTAELWVLHCNLHRRIANEILTQ